jgi:hypothetical protein
VGTDGPTEQQTNEVSYRGATSRLKTNQFLGVWVDAELKWRGHIDQWGGKMRRLLGVLVRARAILDESLLV